MYKGSSSLFVNYLFSHSDLVLPIHSVRITPPNVSVHILKFSVHSSSSYLFLAEGVILSSTILCTPAFQKKCVTYTSEKVQMFS